MKTSIVAAIISVENDGKKKNIIIKKEWLNSIKRKINSFDILPILVLVLMIFSALYVLKSLNAFYPHLLDPFKRYSQMRREYMERVPYWQAICKTVLILSALSFAYAAAWLKIKVKKIVIE